MFAGLRPQEADCRIPHIPNHIFIAHDAGSQSPTLRATTAGLTLHSVLLLGRLALLHALQDLSLLVLDGLVDLGAARGLVAVHLGRKGGVVRAGDLLLGLLLAAAVLRVVLVFGGREAVGYAALVL